MIEYGPETPVTEIEDAFTDFTSRPDMGVLLINQSVRAERPNVCAIHNQIADRIRHLLDTYSATIPTILEIPSKDAPYDASKVTLQQCLPLFLTTSFQSVGLCHAESEDVFWWILAWLTCLHS